MDNKNDKGSATAQSKFQELMLYLNHIGEHERHFNSLESEYRKLASAWLLAALGACGYVLNSVNNLFFDRWYLVIGICLSAAVGIFVLWLIDFKVYHRLLDSFFLQRIKLEKEYSEFLGPIGINIV